MNVISISDKFHTKEDCLGYMENLRWSGHPVCPYCGSTDNIPVKKEFRHHCNNPECKKTFSVLIGTIFEGARLPLPKFFVLIGLMLNARKGISSMQLRRDVGITVRSSWYAAMRVRCAMVETISDMKGTVEADEMYVGGKPRHRKVTADNVAWLSRLEKPKRGRGAQNKVKVAGMVERDGRVITKVLSNFTAQNLLAMLKRYVNIDKATLMTDEFASYNSFDEYVTRHVIKHKQKEYVRGNVHTNTIEGYWSIVKAGIKGQYRVLSRRYFPFYLAEFAYKYNRRNAQSLQFESFMKDALSDGKCLIYHKPKGDPLKIVYPRKNKPAKANTRKFNKANKDAGKTKAKKKIAKAKKKKEIKTEKE